MRRRSNGARRWRVGAAVVIALGSLAFCAAIVGNSANADGTPSSAPAAASASPSATQLINTPTPIPPSIPPTVPPVNGCIVNTTPCLPGGVTDKLCGLNLPCTPAPDTHQCVSNCGGGTTTGGGGTTTGGGSPSGGSSVSAGGGVPIASSGPTPKPPPIGSGDNDGVPALEASSVLGITAPSPSPAPSLSPERGPLGAQPASNNGLPPITNVPSPLQISLSLKLIGINMLVALILAALLALPAELLNGTIRENYDDIARWLGFQRGKASKLHQAWSSLPSHLTLISFVVVAALLYTLLDPGAGLKLTTAAELVGLIGALALITGTHDVARNAYIKRRFRKRGRLITFPAGIVFAVGLVIISRMFNFQPGFIFGLMTGIAFSDQLSDREDGHGLAVASLFVLAVSFAAWFIWIPVKGAVDGNPNAGFPLVAADTLLATVWVAGVQSVVFSLIPIRFMDGEKVVVWSRIGWAVLYVFALFVFVHTVLHPNDNQIGTTNTAQVVYLAVMLVGLTVVSVSTWAFFFVRHRRRHAMAHA
ncbi:MAG: FGLLP motif-containing membrane protein [Candidatus Dormibacteria bacterium]